ncbi:mitochondrial import translocase, subunit Tom22 [Tothia fuscella]|uniref:Mitochondrial import translocase, subunit Tom22 n=1 Tax=Tothia fuscella TaxID=1048955 RepID=A0A9P4U0F0_9PEZI|nr:mitochondrial import translocase, subunit Tom22 [Tothia fuscella]
MVKLEEVPDEELVVNQDGPVGGDDDWDTSSESDQSETSSLASDDLTHESLYERLTALQDILPPSQRKLLTRAVDTSSAWLKTGLTLSGKALWVVSTSALLLGVPWALAYAEEQQMVEMEREMKMQQSASELLTPGASTQQQGAQPAF